MNRSPKTSIAVLAVAAAAWLTCSVGTTAAAAATRVVPSGFYGVDMDPWALQRQGADLSAEMALAARSGVESVRIPVYWFDVQTYGSVNSVPASLKGDFTAPTDGSPPFRWGRLDSVFAAAAAHSIKVLPVVLGAPHWAADGRYQRALPIPREAADYATFCAELAKRYGPSGDFWRANDSIPEVPVREWQIWNEPDIEAFWPQHVGERQTVTVKGVRRSSTKLRFAPTYLAMLRAARTALKAIDPGATVMLASLTNAAWTSLGLIYSGGGKGTFDAVGANVFSRNPVNIVAAIRQIRSVMSAHGDGRVPYTVTEYSWAAPKNLLSPTIHMAWIATTPERQAKNAGTAMDSFRKNRTALRLAGTYWYTWASTGTNTANVWDYAGMRLGDSSVLTSRPVLGAFARRALAAEGCRSKLDSGACIQ